MNSACASPEGVSSWDGANNGLRQRRFSWPGARVVAVAVNGYGTFTGSVATEKQGT
ncbi:hypothetical protein KXR87_11840 [Yokenella regensburgei]|uniref:hypothetical protein n=1 Tax=Yokenella regensburgei TaxID=158877 RepID=UPI003F17E3A2